MAKVLVTDTHLTNIANAIREKNGSSTTYKPSEMADAISSIETGSSGGSTVTKGIVINSWDSSGYATDISLVGMTSIPAYYFYGMFSPSSASNNNVFAKVGGNLHFPDNLTSIGNYCFYNCQKLALTSLPSTVTSLGTYAFYGCTSLTLTSLPSGLTTINKYCFDGCTNLALTSLPNGITSIGEYAFYNCTNLALSSLPNGVTTLGDACFGKCTNLALTSLPSTITSIGSGAFNTCTGLTTLTIPSNCTIKGTSSSSHAFYKCTNLTSVTLGSPGVPYTQTNAGKYIFYYCTNIEKIIMYTSNGTGTANYFYKNSTSAYHTIEFRQA